MADKPSAEIRIDDALVRALLVQARAAIAGVDRMPLRHVDAGWDCELWRLGEDLAVRMPRRAVAAPLIDHEHAALPHIAPLLARTGIALPLPLVQGRPGAGFPWSWSVVPWISGRTAAEAPRTERSAWAEALAAVVSALHSSSPTTFPDNPVRGVPLSRRDDAVRSRLDALASHPDLDAAVLRAARAAWEAGVAAPAWDDAPVWLHGDLHPGNLITADGRLVGVIDFGDVTAGDPACDLAVAWLAFDPVARGRFFAALRPHRSSADILRARAWAVAMASSMLAHSDDDPRYGVLGLQSLHEVSTD